MTPERFAELDMIVYHSDVRAGGDDTMPTAVGHELLAEIRRLNKEMDDLQAELTLHRSDC